MHSVDLAMDGIVRIRHQSQDVRGELLIPLVAPVQAFEQRLTLGRQSSVSILASRQSRERVVHVPLQYAQPGFDGILNRLHRVALGRRCGHLRCVGERVAVNEGMSGRSPLDLAQADKITTLEVAAAMFEFP